MPATTGTTAPAPALPPTCGIKGLVAFGPGYHKGELYTPQRCDRIAANYAATGGRPVPLAKIGHDKQQRYAQSLGFPNVGVVTRCAPVGGGCFEVDIENVPTEVGGKVSAGLLRGASVELKSHQRDPRDPAKELPGDVLTGISLLGEEQPCVQNWPEHLRDRAVPVATFADGSPVPPNHEMARWLDLAAEVSADIASEEGGEFSADRRTVRIRGRAYAAPTLCFSAFDPQPPGPAPMTDEQKAALTAAGYTDAQIAALAALNLTPDQINALAATAPPAAPPAAPPLPGDAAMSADAPPWAKKMFADLEETKKRTGELQASAEATQKKDAEAQMAAFSDRVERAVEPLYRKVQPVVVDAVHKPVLMGLLTAKSFSAEADRTKAFNDYLAPFLAQPDDPRLAKPPGAPVTAPPGADNPFVAAALRPGGFLAQHAPGAAKRLRERAAA